MSVTTRSGTRDPVLADFLSLGNRLSRLMNDGLGSSDWQFRDRAGASWVPPVDIFEDAEVIRILAEIPGVSPADVKISLEHNILTIRGSKQQVAQERTERVHRYERTYGAFERTFTLPATVDASNIKATYEHGVLTVTLPKVERAKPREIVVQVAAK
jgi:HSP20 family protein